MKITTMNTLKEVNSCSLGDIQLLEPEHIKFYKGDVETVNEYITDDCYVMVFLKGFHQKVKLSNMTSDYFKEGVTFIQNGYSTKLCDIKYLKTKADYNKIILDMKRRTLCH